MRSLSTKMLTFLTAWAMFFSLQTVFCEPVHFQAAKQLLVYEAQCVKKELNFKVFSLGGSFMECINMLSLTVEVPKSLCPADPQITINPRSVFVVLLQHFMDVVNKNTKIHPYLKNYPFTPQHFEYRVILPDFDTLSTLEEPKPALVYNSGDRVVYCYRDQETRQLEPFHFESYEDALKIVVNEE